MSPEIFSVSFYIFAFISDRRVSGKKTFVFWSSFAAWQLIGHFTFEALIFLILKWGINYIRWFQAITGIKET